MSKEQRKNSQEPELEWWVVLAIVLGAAGLMLGMEEVHTTSKLLRLSFVLLASMWMVLISGTLFNIVTRIMNEREEEHD